MLDNFKKCDRCGGLWANDAYFGSVHITGKEHRGWLRLCRDCMGKLLFFIDHPEDDEGAEE